MARRAALFDFTESARAEIKRRRPATRLEAAPMLGF
jgi:hypothetical protein